MSIETKQFIGNFPSTFRSRQRKFFQLAKKNIVKSRKMQTKNLSKQIDKIVYGV